MTIHLYATCWNEAKLLPFLFRHYDPIVDRYVIFDDGSTDGTSDLLKAHPRVELRQFPRTDLDDFIKSNQALQNEVWKESRDRADWVIIIDVDEHLFVRGVPLRDFLVRCKSQSITLIPALGYQMISEDFPEPEEHLCYTRTWGAPWSHMSKLGIFNPDAIEETNFPKKGGRHTANPKGHIKLPERDELLLLHYKYLGFERTFERNKIQLDHVGEKQKAHYLAGNIRYAWSRERLRKHWNRMKEEGIDISSLDLKSRESHLGSRWWRKDLKYYVHLITGFGKMLVRKFIKLFTPANDFYRL